MFLFDDKGIILYSTNKRKTKRLNKRECLEIINGKTRMYLKYSENYNEFPKEMGCQVNNMLAYFKKIDD